VLTRFAKTSASLAIALLAMKARLAHAVFPSENVHSRPAFISGEAAAFAVGVRGRFTVTATGIPVPTITLAGTLPPGVAFVDNGDGTATLSGTPGPDSVGTSRLTFTAANGLGRGATQTFTLRVAAFGAAESPKLGRGTLAVLVVLLALAGRASSLAGARVS